MNTTLGPTLLCLVAAPVTAVLRGQAAAPDARFGVMTHFAQGWDAGLVPKVAGSGAAWVRDELYWDIVEPARGTYRFPAQYDAYMAALKQANLQPLITLDFENRNYDSGLTPFTQEGFEGYARYSEAVLARYGQQIRAVEIWNEYNGSFCSGPAALNHTDTYLQMLEAAYNQIKSDRPDVQVVAGSTSGVPIPYWEKLLQGGVLDYSDALAVHPYRYNSAPEGIEDDIAALQKLVRQYNGGQDKPIWVTEIGWGTKAAAAQGDLAIDPATQAKFLARAYSLLLSANVAKIFWYDFQDDQGLTMGLMQGNSASNAVAKPAYAAYATTASQLADARFVAREPSAAGLYSLEFVRPNGQQVRVMWALNPVTVRLTGVTGEVTMLGVRLRPASTTAVVSLNDSPLFVSGPVRGLPAPPAATERTIASSTADFASVQGTDGWSYGYFTRDSTQFTALPDFSITDWTEAWGGPFPYLSVTSTDQHPSNDGQAPITAVRRWTSRVSGTVHVVGAFSVGTQGDGVGVSILVNGSPLFRTLLGGGNPITRTFDLELSVTPGTPVDFAVDPGPGANINYDATSITATISVPLHP